MPNRMPADQDPTAFLEPSGFVLIDAGISDYDAMYETQKELVESRRLGRSSFDYLIFVEHPEVYTYGRKSKLSEEELGQAVKLVAVERGGEVTCHNPGQLVAYPILVLKTEERDLHLHLRRLENTIIDVLRDFGLKGEQRPGATGVWIEGKEKKIASIGVAVSNWVTYHGCAINVTNDLESFSRIRPCGFPSSVMTSMEVELGDRCPSLADVKESFLNHFSHHFHRSLVI